MGTGRDQIVAAVQVALEDHGRFLPYARDIDRPERVTIMLRMDKVVPVEDGPVKGRRADFALLIVGTKSEAKKQADELDEVLDSVLHDLDLASNIVWTEATRATWQGTDFPAWSVACWSVYTDDNPEETP